MRVPNDFYDEVMSIAKERNMPCTKVLEEDGTRIIRNAKLLGRMLFR